jgi:hypothetical protein
LISPADSCITFICSYLISSSHSEVGQFNFVCHLWFRRSALQSTTCLAFEVAFCCVCPFSGVFALSLVCLPFLWCTFSTPTTSAVVLDYNLLFVIQFFWGGVSLPRGCAGLCSRSWLGEFCVVCGAHLFVLLNDAEAGLGPVVQQ